MHNDMTHQLLNVRPTLPASFFALCMTLLTQVNAQQNALKVTPLQPVIGKFSVAYERALGPKTTVQVEYQRWFERRQTGTAFLMPVWFANSSETVSNKGQRWSLSLRQYAKTAMQGLFAEGGVYVGKHDIQTTTETSVLIFWGSSETHLHPDVRVSGLRLGGGWQRTKGPFSFEVSGGLSLNHNAKNVRPTLGMKPASPYSRIAVGVSF